MKLYTVREISRIHNIPIPTIQGRCIILNFKKTAIIYGKRKSSLPKYLLDEKEVQQIIDFKPRKYGFKTEKTKNKILIPEVIYVTRETEIIHSKLNFLTLEQL